MSSFVNPTLLWGLLILAAPILIHLINLMRHRRIQWAAMEFLLASKKKNNTWIKLKELLLLLLRLAAVAAVVLIVAQPLLQNQLGRLFGDTKTNHVVLLDDSFSMSDRAGTSSVFDEAKSLIGRLGAQAARQTTPQTFTLLRYSRAGAGTTGTQYDMLKDRVDANFDQKLDDTLRRLAPSQTAVGLSPALDAMAQFLSEATGEETIVYVVSDFRARDWEEPGNVAEGLAQISERAAQLHLVNCADAARPNLAVTALAPRGGTRAAGVPVSIEVTVRNFGGTPVENVAVLLSEDGRERPAVSIDLIGAGKSETRRFEVFFATAGTHQVTARLQGDAVAADNTRYCLVELPVAVSVLVIDGDPDARNARFLATAFRPGGNARTGLEPQIERPDYLNKHALDKYRTIYLTNVERLDNPAITALENYVKAGGGVVFFIGERTAARFYNEKLYRDGLGLFPVPLLRETQLLVDRLEKGADIEAAPEGLFSIFAGERNSFLAGVTVEKYFSVPKSWSPPADSGTQVLARLRNGDPLAVERKFDKGHVVAILTTAAPLWNNWGRNPSFVVALLELQSHLVEAGSRDESRLVGTPLRMALDAARYQPRVRWLTPGLGEAGSTTVDAPIGPNGLDLSLAETDAAGVYELQLSTTDNQVESQRFAFNVAPDEGDLAIVDRDELAGRLKNVRYDYRQAADFHATSHDLAGSNISDWILYLLVGILVGEQLLAYSASYHPKAKGAPA
ncbi:MAG: BatA domain-containing protein [Planctomycetia bacterium]|nr:BatA domain-containing protein [Planctomycetia bacterium]